MTQEQICALLDRVSQIAGVDKAAIATIQQAVANGDTKILFDEVDFFTLRKLQEAGFEIDIKDIPFIGEGGEA